MNNRLDLDHLKAITSITDHDEIDDLSERIDLSIYDYFINEGNKFSVKNIWSIEILPLDYVYINRYDICNSSYKRVTKRRNKSLT